MRRDVFFKLVAFALLSFIPAEASAVPIKLKAEFGQTVMPEGKDGRVYLRVGLEGIAPEAEGARIPANVMIVIDRSGSMKGERIEQAKEAALMAVERLGESDVLGIVA